MTAYTSNEATGRTNTSVVRLTLYSAQIFSSWKKNIISISLSGGPGSMKNGVMGGRRTHATHIPSTLLGIACNRVTRVGVKSVRAQFFPCPNWISSLMRSMISRQSRFAIENQPHHTHMSSSSFGCGAADQNSITYRNDHNVHVSR